MRINSHTLWRITGTLALLSFLLLAAGFVFALNPQMAAPGKPPTVPGKNQSGTAAPAPHAKQGQLTLVTLGDSLTRGVGDANGKGYVGLVREALAKKTGQQPLLSNLAISGQQSAELISQLQETQIQNQVAAADLILFTIGGNDLFQQSGELQDLDEKKIAQAIGSLAANYEQTLSTLRKVNKEATIVYLSLYNPFGNTEAAPITVKPVLDWNSRAEQISSSYPNVIVVPTYDLFVKKEAAYLYTDHFHPNAEGYARMAERVLQALE